MPDIDHIIEQLLNDRRINESATFSSRTFSDQPLIERGSDLKARLERSERDRAARISEREARLAARRSQRTERRRDSDAPPTPPQAIFELHLPGMSQTNANQPAQPRSSGFISRIRAGRLPNRIREMRKLERGSVPHSLAYGSSAAASLFYRQARLMEDYEDTYEFSGSYQQYYPTYASMSDQQLRGYFTWRTRVRHGEVTPAPLSFAFVYLYELLAGIGTTPGVQGYHDLKSFGIAWQDAIHDQHSTLNGYLSHWLHDYVIYHGIVDEVPTSTLTHRMAHIAEQVVVLLQAEHDQLRKQDAKPRIPNPAAEGDAPSAQAVFEALGACASYHLCDSRLAKAEPELTAAVTTDVFSALVTHCARRRKTDFVEGLFGYATSTWYTMYSGAVFYEEERHPDTVVDLGPYERFICKNGLWQHWRASGASDRNKELGAILHQIDFELRQQLDYPYPLKQRKALPKYVQRIISKAVSARLEERAEEERQRAEAERRRITIDRSQLASIRAAAAVTQEALLTDEERGIEETSSLSEPNATVAMSELVSASAPPPVDAQDGSPSQDDASIAMTHATPVASTPPAEMAPSSPQPSAEPTRVPGNESEFLTSLELRLVRGMLEGTPASSLLSPTDPFVSVVVDTINEKFFDIVGDAVIEFDGDEPYLIEDYLDDIREVLAS